VCDYPWGAHNDYALYPVLKIECDNNLISKEGSPTLPYTAQNQPYWDTKQMKEKKTPNHGANVTSLAMPRRSVSIMPKQILYLCATLDLKQS
jgi:hypothetical protein